MEYNIQGFDDLKDIFLHCNDEGWEENNYKSDRVITILADAMAKLTVLIPYTMQYKNFINLLNEQQQYHDPLVMQECADIAGNIDINIPDKYACQVSKVLNGICYVAHCIGSNDDIARQYPMQVLKILNSIDGRYSKK